MAGRKSLNGLSAEFRKQADRMPAEFLRCYVRGHKWNEDALWRYPQPGGYVVHIDCARCGMAVEVTYIGGLVEARRYVKPEGKDQYGFTGLGHRTEQERRYLNESWLSTIPVVHPINARGAA